jgi:hypothetical protein
MSCRRRWTVEIDYRGCVTQQPGKVRRTPKYAAFLITGGCVGLLVGFLLSLRHPDPRYDASAALGFLGLIFAGVGVLVGGIIAVLVDKRS